MSARRVSIHRPEYASVVACLVEVRKKAGLTQTVLASRMKRTQGFISAVEGKERRLDLLQAWEWCRACGSGLADLGELIDKAMATERPEPLVPARPKSQKASGSAGKNGSRGSQEAAGSW